MNLERIKKDLYISFEKSEAQTLREALKRRIQDNNHNIKRVENNPKNEGQATYSQRIKELRYDTNFCNELINVLNDKSLI